MTTYYHLQAATRVSSRTERLRNIQVAGYATTGTQPL